MTNIPLFLLHGALGSAKQFDPLRNHLPAGMPVIAPDFPGHGEYAADTAPFSMEQFSEFLFNLMEEQHIPEARFFGYSMGGYAALFFASKHPDRVRNLFTLGTKFDWTPETASKETALLDPEKIEAKVPAFAQNLAERHGAGYWKAVVSRTAGLLYNLGAGEKMSQETLSGIHCPVTIGLGEWDNMVHPEESRAVANTLPQGRFEILPGCKHPFEQVNFILLAERIKDILP